MAKKPGPKKNSKQRRAGAAPKQASARPKGTAKKAAPPKRSTGATQKPGGQSTGSTFGALASSRAVRGGLAATLVSAAGALLFWKRRGDRGEERQASEAEATISSPRVRPAKPAATGSRKSGGRRTLPATSEADPLVAAGVAGRVAKKSAGAAPRRRKAKPAAKATPASPEPSELPQAEPGAYPDGSPSGDTAGRTSIEGGNDRTQ